MATITLSELYLSGSELFQDSESFLNDLSDANSTSVYGGHGAGFDPLLDYGIKGYEFALLGLGINNVVSLAKSFSGTSIASANSTCG
ncbi:hypothetical protein A4S05_28065 [Nostoc sp. KVJ20]|uniref:hypothetical protein n=1 Tax=unclassified Nostoc TaxID=2593658 RepID=UPI00083E3B6D|nr:hypothetical protein [Nostoc sp. KVJ20]ODH01631.1 hypothetical protein A4S05_28065 [Nostoc sp. KVJ20]